MIILNYIYHPHSRTVIICTSLSYISFGTVLKYASLRTVKSTLLPLPLQLLPLLNLVLHQVVVALLTHKRNLMLEVKVDGTPVMSSVANVDRLPCIHIGHATPILLSAIVKALSRFLLQSQAQHQAP